MLPGTLLPHFADRKLRIRGVSGFAPITLGGGRAEVRIQIWVTLKPRLLQETLPPPLPQLQPNAPSFLQETGARSSAKREAGTGKPLCFNLKIITPLPKGITLISSTRVKMLSS